ncbi:MAG: hypothetical protein AB1586_14525 [Pseudomonadota bacterium]
MGAKDVLTSHVKKAEQRYGLRTRKFHILKVQGRDNEIPETVPDGRDGCLVHYYRAAKHDPDRLRFQLSHEAIHVLLGSLKRECRYIEEGLAVWFSLGVSKESYRKVAEDSLPKLFADALALLRQANPTDEKIQNLRKLSPDLDKLEVQHLVNALSIDRDLAEKLHKRVPPDIALRT